MCQRDGGPVFGGALAIEFGILGIEGRVDATEVGLDVTGARYDVRGTAPPFEGLEASVTVSNGRFDVDRIRAAPGESKHQWGVNGGAGLRVGRRVALVGEVRVFYFREYELHLAGSNGEILGDLIGGLAPVRFKPIFVNAQAGVAFRF